jgi:hypothetical protein
MKMHRGLTWLLVLLSGLGLAACATVNQQHPEVATDAKAPAATVYFIRPILLKPKGYADNPLHIDYQGKPLVVLPEESYTMVRIKPSEGMLRVNSMTRFTNLQQAIKVWRERHYKFLADKTYFIYLKQINEEFRGIFYEPEPVDLAEAKRLVKDARASGAARDAPIDKLTQVNAPPSSTIDKLPPALPENIYKSEKYLHKVQ